MFRLETGRLLIRPWKDADRPPLLEILRDVDVVRYINAGRPFSDEEVDAALARHARNLAEHGVCMGAAIEKSSGRLAGIAGVQPLGTTGDLEIGWVFGRHVWGRGYATEAGVAAMRHVLETLGRPRVVAIIDPDNLPSKRVAARLGMEYEARCTGAQLGHRNPEIVVDLYVRLNESWTAGGGRG
jgi:RimJ/RimL family protein N-acetyltransferase